VQTVVQARPNCRVVARSAGRITAADDVRLPRPGVAQIFLGSAKLFVRLCVVYANSYDGCMSTCIVDSAVVRCPTCNACLHANAVSKCHTCRLTYYPCRPFFRPSDRLSFLRDDSIVGLIAIQNENVDDCNCKQTK
jgi:hypothetical protein